MTRREFAAGIVAVPMTLPQTTSWIAADCQGGAERASYPEANRAVSLGSLLKPFLALAYLRSGKTPPLMTCLGARAGCWKPDGHGPQSLVPALANSCNVYFLELARALDRVALDSTCLAYGLQSPERDWSPSRLIGIGDGWPQPPSTAARAFARLASDAHLAEVRPVLAAMALCARSGTAKQAGFACYAKTGTAECPHARHASGDGYAVALYPLEHPRRSLLVMQHGTTGAQAAAGLRALSLRLA